MTTSTTDFLDDRISEKVRDSAPDASVMVKVHLFDRTGRHLITGDLNSAEFNLRLWNLIRSEVRNGNEITIEPK